MHACTTPSGLAAHLLPHFSFAWGHLSQADAYWDGAGGEVELLWLDLSGAVNCVPDCSSGQDGANCTAVRISDTPTVEIGSPAAPPHTPLLHEGETLAVSLRRVGDVSDPSSVSVVTFDGTAIAGEDFSDASGEVVFEAGATSATVELEIIADNAWDGAGNEQEEFWLFVQEVGNGNANVGNTTVPGPQAAFDALMQRQAVKSLQFTIADRPMVTFDAALNGSVTDEVRAPTVAAQSARGGQQGPCLASARARPPAALLWQAVSHSSTTARH